MKIYLDMDGVLADFFGGLEQHFDVKHWKQIPKTEESIMGLKGTDFFNQLKPYPSSNELVNFVINLTGEDGWGICSSPLRGDRDNSAFWKRTWLQRHFMMGLWRTLSSLVEKNSSQRTGSMVNQMS